MLRRWRMKSKSLHSYIAPQMCWPLGWDSHLWSAKRPRSLLEQLDSGVEFELIEKQRLGSDEPNCETNHQRAEREWFQRFDHFHD